MRLQTLLSQGFKVFTVVTVAFHFNIDIDECTGDPCNNGGTCVDGQNEYVCHCKPGYNGTNCETGR